MGEFETARQESDIAVRRFMAKHLNVPIALALTADYWPGAEYWEAAGSLKQADVQYIIDHSEVITVGTDGGGLDDLLGLAVLGRSKHNPRQWLAWHHAWAHQSVLQRRKEIASVLLDFARQGDLTIIDHMGDDTDAVANIVAQVYHSGLFPAE